MSWISRASRSRSAAVPASRDKRALSARVAASSATSAASCLRCRIDVMITVPITGAMITPMSVKAMAMPRFGDRIPSLSYHQCHGDQVDRRGDHQARRAGSMSRTRVGRSSVPLPPRPEKPTARGSTEPPPIRRIILHPSYFRAERRPCGPRSPRRASCLRSRRWLRLCSPESDDQARPPRTWPPRRRRRHRPSTANATRRRAEHPELMRRCPLASLWAQPSVGTQLP